MRRPPPSKRTTPAKRDQLARLCEPELASIVKKNIESIEEHRRVAEESRGLKERIADAITRVAGSLGFVLFHVAWFGAWVLVNAGLFGLRPFDPVPFGMLTTIVSLEAIFLSTFVLVSQNRQAEIADQRAQLDLQINLLAEYEVTKMLKLQDAMAKHLQVKECDQEELDELKQDVEPEAVLEKLESKAEPERMKAHDQVKPGKDKPKRADQSDG
jgi:uncharacterized membrane protein